MTASGKILSFQKWKYLVSEPKKSLVFIKNSVLRPMVYLNALKKCVHKSSSFKSCNTVFETGVHDIKR